MNLKINARSIDGNTSLISLEGEVDVYTAPQLKEQIVSLLDSNVTRIVVDLTSVEYLDSTALGVLIGGLKRLRERDGSLDLICPNPRAKRIFEITGLDKIFNIYATEGEALGKRETKEDP